MTPGWRSRSAVIEATPGTFGNSDVGKGRQAQVEFVSANPTGPLTVGHAWGAVLGDTIANLLTATGWAVTREYYFNNGGRQMRLLGESLRVRYLELLGDYQPIPQDGYQGDYMRWIAARWTRSTATAWLTRTWTSSASGPCDHLRPYPGDPERLGIHFDVYYNELDLYKTGNVNAAVQTLATAATPIRRTARCGCAPRPGPQTGSGDHPLQRRADVPHAGHRLSRG